MKPSKTKGFTLIELLVVIAIIGLLSSIVLASLNTARGKARDAQRLSEMQQLQSALELYYSNNGTYPNSNFLGCGGWEASGADETAGVTFIQALVSDKDMPAGITDPTPSTEGTCGNFAYYFYPAQTGCPRSFYVLGIRQTDGYSSSKYPSSPGWSCSGSRDWQAEFSWVTGNYAAK